ncbi:hypothetical protein [Mesorhizobium sp. M0011]|uniref:hypothetical protein n=1 Tax=Mesorhizobium sp. M0011 TaxID=2956839 RepID=UPI003337F0F6
MTVLALAIVISVPFVTLDANYFGDKGFLDRFGNFSAVLTGFYIAALVGVASFASSFGELDDEIEVGRISRPVPDPAEGEDPEEFLTRRQYVCSMFGYLAFVSLVLSVGAILFIVAADQMQPVVQHVKAWLEPSTADCTLAAIRGAIIIGFDVVVAHMLITTCHGLYYLIDRLYAQKPKISQKRK